MTIEEQRLLPAPPPWRDWLARHLRLEVNDRFDVYLSVARSATLRDATYWAEILLSAGIATLGLVMGSPAVIIGAMLISPLMGPIMSAGLALAAGDFVLAMRAILSISLSSVLAVGFSTTLVVLLPFREMTEEIAARTHPNTLDLIIALFSGAVGALAVSKSLRGVATSIPGVAIAVALMPPLCVTGYGVGVFLTLDRAQGLAVLRGGSLLFITNLVAITFSSMLVFLMLHIDSDAVRERIRQWRMEDPESARFQKTVDGLIPDQIEKIGSLPARLALVFTLMTIVFIPLKRSFDALAAEITHRQQVTQAQKVVSNEWDAAFGQTRQGQPRSYVDFLDVQDRDGKLRLTVRAFVSQSISAAERTEFVRRLARELNRNESTIDLALVEIPTSGYQVARAKSDPEVVPAARVESIGTQLQRVSQDAVRRITTTQLPPSATLLDGTITLGTAVAEARITYLSQVPISEDARALIASRIREQLDLPQLALQLSMVPAVTKVAFTGRSTMISPESVTALGALAEIVRTRPRLRVRMLAASADQRAIARTGAVRAFLLERGIPAARLQTELAESLRDQGFTVVVEAIPPGS